jgi:hypothetical protein
MTAPVKIEIIDEARDDESERPYPSSVCARAATSPSWAPGAVVSLP